MQTINLTNLQLATQTAAAALKAGGLIIYPTDTVYGIGCDATNQAAVDKLLKFKGNRHNKAISVAVRDQAMAQQFAELNDTAKNLYANFLPGPLTVISTLYALRPTLASGIPSPENTIGIRIIPHPFLDELFKYIDFPITATSGNISNGPNPRSLEQWLKDTPATKQALIDLFINAGQLPHREPSTVIDTTKEATQIVRQGAIKLESSSMKHESSTYISKSPEETQSIAIALINRLLASRFQLLDSATLLALQGNLGAGKTVFTQGLAQALGITEALRSPTYTLVKEYPISPLVSLTQTTLLGASGTSGTSRTLRTSPPSLFHIDAWRLSSPEEFADLGLDSMLKPGNLIVLEWPQRLASILNQLQQKARLVLVDIKVVDETTRQITISSSF